MPDWVIWHDTKIETLDPRGPELIRLKNRKVSVYKDGECIFESPVTCRVSNALYTDIDSDGSNELILLNYNIGRYGKHRPFWVRWDPPLWHQHIYIYDHDPERNIMKPIWMASDIGMEAKDMSLYDDNIIILTDRQGNETHWTWRSFGLKCLDNLEL